MTDLNDAQIRSAESTCYALAVDDAETADTQDARLRGIFADDVGRPTKPQEPLRGVDNIIASFESRPRNRLTQHFVTSIRVRMAEPEGRKASAKQIIGIYRDRYVRTKNGWRFAERRGRTLFHT